MWRAKITEERNGMHERKVRAFVSTSESLEGSEENIFFIIHEPVSCLVLSIFVVGSLRGRQGPPKGSLAKFMMPRHMSAIREMLLPTCGTSILDRPLPTLAASVPHLLQTSSRTALLLLDK